MLNVLQDRFLQYTGWYHETFRSEILVPEYKLDTCMGSKKVMFYGL